MNKMNPRFLMAAAGLAFSFAVMPSHAAVPIPSWQILIDDGHNPDHRTFVTDTNNDIVGVNVTGVRDEPDHPASTVNNTVTAWSTGNNNGVLQLADFTDNGSSGLGVLHDGESTDSPDHAMDNINNGQDAMLFDFDGKSVELTDVQIGWYGNDSDVSILAWTGDQDATAAQIETSLTLGNYDDLAANTAWDIVGNYQIHGDGSTYTESVNAGHVTSSYWLIGAFNNAFGSNYDAYNGAYVCSDGSWCLTTNDAVKLKELSVIYTPDDLPAPSTSVAEPSSLLLLAFGMMAPVAMRRRLGKRAIT